MKHLIQKLCFGLAATLSTTAALADSKPFENEYNFDDGTIPAGWVANTPWKCQTGAYFGSTSNSGDYLLGAVAPTSENVVYTPVMHLEGGKKCTIEFSYLAPGPASNGAIFNYGFAVKAGSAQNAQAQTIDVATIANAVQSSWKKCIYSFTPDETGDFCFSLTPKPYTDAMASRCGNLYFDTFFISGTEVETSSGENPEPVESEPFAFTQNFDNDDDFTSDSAMPKGWLLEGPIFRRADASVWGGTNHSGNFVIGTDGPSMYHGLFTPMVNVVAGEEYNLEFWFQSIGTYPRVCGVEVYVADAQNSSNLINDFKPIASTDAPADGAWTKVTAKYTPTKTGELCFAIGFNTAGGNAALWGGNVIFDDFKISGTRVAEGGKPGGGDIDPDIDLEPNDDNLADCVDLPYLEDFNGDNYDGTSNLPVGWSTTGSLTFITASIDALPAKVGKYYMIAYHNPDNERDDRAYTPFFNLQAGTEYTVSYWVYMQGNDYNEDGALTLPTLDFTVGTEQEADFHKTIDSFSEKCTTWVKRTHTFTPKVDGPYCFAFMLSGPVNSGILAIDDLQITAPGLVPRVDPQFYLRSPHLITDSRVAVTFPGHQLQAVNASRYAETYKWTCQGAEPETSTDESPFFQFPTEGYYTLQLEATNSRGTRSTQRNFYVGIMDEDETETLGLTLYHDGVDELFAMGRTPHFATDDYDFVTGFNHYYNKVAQRFDFSRDLDMTLHSLNVFIPEANYTTWMGIAGTLNQNQEPMSIVVYGSKADGSLDESKVLGRLDSTIGKLLISYGYTSMGAPAPATIEFEKPITIGGTFYVAMEFSDNMEIDVVDANRGRSFIATSALRHAHGVTSLYGKPLDSTDSAWFPVEHFDPNMKGLGAYWTLWTRSAKTSQLIAVDSSGAVQFSAMFDGDILTVSGTHSGETVTVHNLGGSTVASTRATDESTSLACGHLPSGVYIVTTASGSIKVVK